jgi:hypothetical protein
MLKTMPAHQLWKIWYAFQQCLNFIIGLWPVKKMEPVNETDMRGQYKWVIM